MIVKLSDYIVSPLAMGTQANYKCVKEGQTRLCTYAGKWNLPEPFVASMIDDDVIDAACAESNITGEYTKFERMAILAASRALQRVPIRSADKEVLFILSTTKGNIGILDEQWRGAYSPSRVLLTETAKQITRWFHNPNTPLVVCNACISGLSAQIEAVRALESGLYRYVVVIGADVLSPFIVSGFQSLKALSDSCCRPFDEDRTGLNLGEAAACIVYGCVAEGSEEARENWHITCSAVRNDAFHTSTPSKTAEGACAALKQVLSGQKLSELAFVNLHGTATLFNDEMEAVALDRMGLSSLPANGLKGYFGHTLGASGVLETLISMEAVDDHTILATKGFDALGVSRKINVSNRHRQTDGRAFLKMMAGFGGCNAALIFEKGEEVSPKHQAAHRTSFDITHTVKITPREVVVDGVQLAVTSAGMSMLKDLYHTCVGDYPKFYKMDPLCKLGFIASELLLEAEAKTEGVARFSGCDDRAVVFVGRSASLCADRLYQQTIQHADDYFPSPSAFIYTLPNILTGEIAIRNQCHGETLYLSQDSPQAVNRLMEQVLSSPGTASVIGGWIEIANTDEFEANISIIRK